MAITRAQQFKQMLREGGRIGFKGGADFSTVADSKGKTGAKSVDISPTGDVRTSDRPPSAPDDRGSDIQNLTQQLVREGKTPREIRRITGTQNPVQRFIEDYTKNTRKFLYNTFPNNPRNELDYLRSLPASQRALLSPALRAKLEALELDEDQDLLDTAKTKFTFDEFEELRKFQPTEGLNFAEYAAKFKGAPGLLYSGDVGNLLKIKNPDGTFRYERKLDDGSPQGDLDLEARLRLLEEQRKKVEEPVTDNPLSDILSRLMANGGRVGVMDGGMLVQPGFGGTRQGYRTAKTQESKQQSVKEFKERTSKQDDPSPEQTITKPFGDDSGVISFTPGQLASFGIVNNPIARQRFANLMKTQKAIELSDVGEEETATDATQLGTGDILTPVPDLTDPKVAGGIAEAGGLTTTPKRVGGKEVFGTTIGGETVNVPSDLSQKAIEEIQTDKRQLGLTREQVIDKAKEFDYPTSITEEGAGTIYDMVQADQLPRTLAAEGGIMDLETGRQMYFLGKLVKKATRAVKKIVKSPIGKAALGIAALKFGPGMGTFLKNKALDFGLYKAGEGLTGKGMFSLAAALTAAPLLFQQEEEDQPIDPSMLGPRLDIAGIYNDPFGTQYRRMAADGGRIGFQEGGGIEQRLEQLGGDVSSAEKTLQDINQRLKTAESSLGSGGGLGGLPGLPTGSGISGGELPIGLTTSVQTPDPFFGNTSLAALSQRPLPESMQSEPQNLGTFQLAQARPGLLPNTRPMGMAAADGTMSLMPNPLSPQQQMEQANASAEKLSPEERVRSAQGTLANRAMKSPQELAYLDRVIKSGGKDYLYDIDFFRNPGLRAGGGGSLGIPAAGYAEGGDVEPVAKKTMPLLDLDGQEMDLRDNGGFVPIGRMEKADDVPARLSKNEFVFTADAVRNAGDGDIDKGAEVMYNMMKNLEDGGNVSEESQGLEGARNMFQTAQRLEEVL